MTLIEVAKETLKWFKENVREVEVKEIEGLVERVSEQTVQTSDGRFVFLQKTKFKTLSKLTKSVRNQVAAGRTVYLRRVMHVPARTIVISGKASRSPEWFEAEYAVVAREERPCEAL